VSNRVQTGTDLGEEEMFGKHERRWSDSSETGTGSRGLKLDSTEKEVPGKETGGSNAATSTLPLAETPELKSDTKNG
jgi:hypothetical protein